MRCMRVTAQGAQGGSCREDEVPRSARLGSCMRDRVRGGADCKWSGGASRIFDGAATGVFGRFGDVTFFGLERRGEGGGGGVVRCTDANGGLQIYKRTFGGSTAWGGEQTCFAARKGCGRAEGERAEWGRLQMLALDLDWRRDSVEGTMEGEGERG